MNKPFILTSELVRKVVETVDKGLVKGVGFRKPGHMCVEAAVCYAMGLPHGDEPTCVDPAIRRLKIYLNDSAWSSNEARAKGMRRLAVLQLGTKESGFDSVDFANRVALMTIKVILPIALTAAGLHDHANICKNVITLESGRDAADAAADAARAASYAAADAARAASYVAADASYAAADAARAASYFAADAARAASYAASYASYAASYAAGAARDNLLSAFAKGVEDILIDMGVPAVAFLHLLEE